MAKILDGKALSQRLMGEYKARIEEINRNDSICLAMVIAGGDPSSLQYVKANEKKCVSIGINVKIIQLDYDVTQEALEKTISELNDDASVNGVLIQMPLPKHIDKQRVVNLLSPDKDLDCQGDGNIVSLYNNTEGFCPCTPSGAIELLKGYGISLSGKNVCVLGRSSVVGKPACAYAFERKRHCYRLPQQNEKLKRGVPQIGYNHILYGQSGACDCRHGARRSGCA